LAKVLHKFRHNHNLTGALSLFIAASGNGLLPLFTPGVFCGRFRLPIFGRAPLPHDWRALRDSGGDKTIKLLI